MKRFFAALGLLLFLSGNLPNAYAKENDGLRLLYWNIQNGMWDGQGDNYDRFVKWVSAQEPDICVWCEAQSIFVTDSKEKMAKEDRYLVDGWKELAARYGHKYVYVGAHRDNYPQAITSRYPIRNVERIVGAGPDSVVTHGAAWAAIEIGTKTLNIVTLHLWPQKWAYKAKDKKTSGEKREGDFYRRKEIEYICKHTILTHPDAADEYWVMLGDHNARSSVDNYKYGLRPDTSIFMALDYVQKNTPYLDVIAQKHPGDFRRTVASGKRIDFVYLTPALYGKVVDADVIYDSYTEPVRDARKLSNFYHPSDHLPIVVDFGRDVFAPIDTRSAIAENRLLAAGGYHSYEVPSSITDTPAPKGYKPFYVSHFGRHGSRYHTPRKIAYGNPVDMLRADSLGLLTPEGRDVLEKMLRIRRLHEGMMAELSIRGYREHEGIAGRLCDRYPEIFGKKGGRDSVRCISSNFSRCILSMDAFTGALRARKPSLRISQITGQKYFDLLSAGHTQTQDIAGQVALSRGRTLPLRFNADRLGKALFKTVPDWVDLQNVANSIYCLGCIAEDLEIETGGYMDLFSVFTPEELHAQWSIYSDAVYGEMCGSVEYGDRVAGGAAKIVRRIVQDADDALRQDSPVAADLRFGHDNGLLPLISLLGLEGTVSVPFEGSYEFFPSYNDQTASNLQLIFYRDKAGDALVKILFNEKETRLKGLAPYYGPYYRWTSLRKMLCAVSTSVVAHRGYWECEAAGYSQNSIASLKAAAAQGFSGCELDIHLTADSCILVNHDPTVNGKVIATSPLSAFEEELLPNGQRRPTLQEYLGVAKNYPAMRLVIEFKQNSPALVDRTVAALQSCGMMSPSRVAFIAFSYDVCRYVAKKWPEFSNQYLNGDKTPKELLADGINGLDYRYKVLKTHPEWVSEAHALGMYVNCWTVNREDDINAMIDLGVDAITTNRPEQARTLIRNAGGRTVK